MIFEVLLCCVQIPEKASGSRDTGRDVSWRSVPDLFPGEINDGLAGPAPHDAQRREGSVGRLTGDVVKARVTINSL